MDIQGLLLRQAQVTTILDAVELLTSVHRECSPKNQDNIKVMVSRLTNMSSSLLESFPTKDKNAYKS